MTESKLEKLARMANQIGDFYAAMPEKEAAESVATHLKRFWTPKMIRELIAYVGEGHAGLNPTAARALGALKQTAGV